MLEIDGSYGEGGGQLLRTAVALAALTATPIRFRSIRMKRDKPGLAPQHIAAVRAVSELCDTRRGAERVKDAGLKDRMRFGRGGKARD
jgi:RNA 3'-terminal phosphate cyclase